MSTYWLVRGFDTEPVPLTFSFLRFEILRAVLIELYVPWLSMETRKKAEWHHDRTCMDNMQLFRGARFNCLA